MSDLIGGLYPKAKNEKAPEYVIGKLSINVQQFREWFDAYTDENPGEEWINTELLVGKTGKAYAKLDTWKPTKGEDKPAKPRATPAPPSADFGDSVPF